MNVPEYARATENAIRAFDKRIAEAREHLDEELTRYRSEFLDEQPVAVEVDADYALRKRP